MQEVRYISSTGGKVEIDLPVGNWKVTLEETKAKKTVKQLNLFHGPIVTQVQEFMRETQGEEWTRQEVKYWLKDRFLTKRQVRNEAGRLVFEHVPDHNGVNYKRQVFETPSLESLNVEEMNQFINRIQSFFTHEAGWPLSI